MKWWHIVIGIALAAVITYVVAMRDREIQKQIQEAVRNNRRIINADSLQSAVEVAVMAKLKDSLAVRDLQINKLKSDLAKTRKRNEELYNLYQSISVDMPEY